MLHHFLVLDSQWPFTSGLSSLIQRLDPTAVVDCVDNAEMAMVKLVGTVNTVIASPVVRGPCWFDFIEAVENCPIIVLTESRTAETPFVLLQDTNIIGTLERDSSIPVATLVIKQAIDKVAAYEAREKPIQMDALAAPQAEILKMYHEGHSERDIAARLGKRPSFVRGSLRHILRDARVMYRRQLVL